MKAGRTITGPLAILFACHGAVAGAAEPGQPERAKEFGAIAHYYETGEGKKTVVIVRGESLARQDEHGDGIGATRGGEP